MMNNWLQSRLRLKLLLIVIIAVSVGLLIVMGAFYVRFSNKLQADDQHLLRDHLMFLSNAIQKEKLSANDRAYLGSFARQAARLTLGRITILDANGLVLADSETRVAEQGGRLNYGDRPEIIQAKQDSLGRHIQDRRGDSPRFLYLASAVKKDGQPIGYLRLTTREPARRQFLSNLGTYSVLAGVLVVIISAAMVGLFSTRIIRNLEEIVKRAQQIAKGDLSSKIEISSQDEFRQLALALNEMSHKLEVSLTRLSRDRQDLDTVLSSINEGIIAIAHNHKVIFHNQRAWQLLGNGEQKPDRKFYYEVLNEKHLVSLLNSFFEKNLLISDEIILENQRTLEVVISPLKIEGKPRSGAVMVLRDVTDYKKLEKIRSDFVANVSHEFKTPLAAIRASAETLLDWGLSDHQISRKYTQKILKQSNHLEALVTDILQLARIERLQNIELQPFSPRKIIRETLQEYQEIAAARQIKLEEQLPADLTILGEPEMFHSVIANLIDNAIKYTGCGGHVLVLASINSATATISVRDNGIGIPAAKIERIFERFYRVDQARDRSVAGTGLGLSIVKHLVELQNGKVWVESNVNEGSCFFVQLPLYKSASDSNQTE